MGEESPFPIHTDNEPLYAVGRTDVSVDTAPATGVIKPKKIIAKKPIVDPRIELTDAELIASRERYDQDQQRIGRELHAQKEDKLAYFSAMEVRVAVVG
ncbi:hypothetical protein BS47DRAFT_23153 [Hydnum rufescens UP504]|uniref:Uncharacterized protein n=1 Tax=Hydnum rufescens UP504 TaxID=1448309 RepID=A0A9P6DZA8_9AGAM|nr:hypothetical protein BS47DRAFT_23153 [Hydnum rufescens UP504]